MKLTQILARQRVRRAYFASSELAADYSRDLYTTTDPAARAELLDRFADCEAAMARRHTTAFGPAPMPDEDGRDVADALASSAVLLRMLAATERAADDPDAGSRYVFWCLADDATSVELDLWAELAATRDRGLRAELLDRISPHVAERGEDAETLTSHAYTERELARAERESRTPRAPKLGPSRWAIAAGVCVIVVLAFAAHGLFGGGLR